MPGAVIMTTPGGGGGGALLFVSVAVMVTGAFMVTLQGFVFVPLHGPPDQLVNV